jgi:hypothetical protein
LVGFNGAVKREETAQLVNSTFYEAFLNGVAFSPQPASLVATGVRRFNSTQIIGILLGRAALATKWRRETRVRGRLTARTTKPARQPILYV